MPQSKKILVSLPEKLLSEVDDLTFTNKTNRSEFIREAIRMYVLEQKKLKMSESMKKGYVLMGDINLKLSEAWFNADNELLKSYEEKLSECE